MKLRKCARTSPLEKPGLTLWGTVVIPGQLLSNGKVMCGDKPHPPLAIEEECPVGPGSGS